MSKLTVLEDLLAKDLRVGLAATLRYFMTDDGAIRNAPMLPNGIKATLEGVMNGMLTSVLPRHPYVYQHLDECIRRGLLDASKGRRRDGMLRSTPVCFQDRGVVEMLEYGTVLEGLP
jgi:hypothetical protein